MAKKKHMVEIIVMFMQKITCDKKVIQSVTNQIFHYQCPFHGRIIPRDALGNPNGNSGSLPGPSKESSNAGMHSLEN